jgi:hypothetical protein
MSGYAVQTLNADDSSIPMRIHVIGDNDTILTTHVEYICPERVISGEGSVSSDFLISRILEYQKKYDARYDFMLKYDPGDPVKEMTELSSPPLATLSFSSHTGTINTAMVLLVLRKKSVKNIDIVSNGTRRRRVGGDTKTRRRSVDRSVDR